MELSGVSPSGAADAVSGMRQVQTAQNVQMTVLKKALDIQKSSAAAMLQGLTGPLPLAPAGPVGTKANVLA